MNATRRGFFGTLAGLAASALVLPSGANAKKPPRAHRHADLAPPGEDFQSRAACYLRVLQDGLMSINDIRAEEALPPLEARRHV